MTLKKSRSEVHADQNEDEILQAASSCFLSTDVQFWLARDVSLLSIGWVDFESEEEQNLALVARGF